MYGYLIAVVVPTYEDCLKEADACYDVLRKNKVSITSMQLNSVYTENGIIEFFSRTWLNYKDHTIGKRYTKVFYANPDCPAFVGRVQEETSSHENFLDWVLKREGSKSLQMENRQEMLNYIHENTTLSSQYAQLAEEAIELAHCAQKIERILRKEQPVAEGVTFEKEFGHLLEEFADVELCVAVLQLVGGSEIENTDTYLNIFDEKLKHWVDRLKEDKRG